MSDYSYNQQSSTQSGFSPSAATSPTSGGGSSESVGAEKAVRRYLTFLSDPGSLRDQTKVDDLARRASEADDVLDRVRLISERDRAKDVDADEIVDSFVKNAGAWAAENGVTAAALAEVGVPRKVLAKAGLLSDRRRSAGGGGSRRARSVTLDQVKSHVRSLHGQVTINEVMDAVGGSQGTIRKAFDEMLAAGEIERRQADNHSGRGRAPYVYTRR